MNKLPILAMLLVVGLAVSVQADYSQDFDAFTLGTLVAQENWEANSGINVVTTTTDGDYTGGRALERPAYGDAWPRGLDLVLGLDPDNYDGVEYGFDVRSDTTTQFTVRFFPRDYPTAVYGASVGVSLGEVRLRTNGEGGTDIIGTNMASSAIYGPSSDPEGGYWEKGDWLRIIVRLTGENFSTATVYIYNLSRGGTEIPSGIVGVDTATDYKTNADIWDSVSYRVSSAGTFVDNAYIMNYEAPSTLATNPSPSAGEQSVTITQPMLSWTAAAGATSHEVYFGTDSGSLTQETVTGSTSYTLPYVLDLETTYYWRVDEVIGGTTYTGDVWSFTTHGELMAYEGFDYLADSDLTSTGNGEGGLGWSDKWQRELGGYCYADVVADSLYPDFFFGLGVEGNKILLDNDGPTGNTDAMRPLATPIDLSGDQTYYVSFLAEGTDNTNVNMSMEFYDAKGGTRTLALNMFYFDYPGTSGAQFALRGPTGALSYFGSWQSNTTYLIVAKIVAAASGDDVVYMTAVGPEEGMPEGEPASWDVSVTIQSDAVLPWIKVFARANDTFQGAFDEIRVGLSWDVVAGYGEYPRDIAYEGFDYIPNVDLKSSGNGTGGYGWASDWERTLGGYCYVNVLEGSLIPPVYWPLGTLGNRVEHNNDSPNGSDAMRKLSRGIDMGIDQDYYISFLCMAEATDYNSATFAMYDQKGGSRGFAFHMFYDGYANLLTSPQFALRDADGLWTPYGFGAWEESQVYLVILKVSAQAQGDDTVYCKVYDSGALPTDEPTTWDMSASSESDLMLEWVQIDGRADVLDQWAFDEIHVGTSYAAVSGWPQVCGDAGTVPFYDLNGDCVVSLPDFAGLAGDWMACTIPGQAGCQWGFDETPATDYNDPDPNTLEVYGPITVDGDISDWAGAKWIDYRYSSGYQASNAADVTAAKGAFAWDPTNPQEVYVAVVVTDTDQNFANDPNFWNAGDAIEIRFSMNETSTSTAWNESPYNFDTAQYYHVGPQAVGGGAWASLGPLGAPGDDPYTNMPAENTIDIDYAVTVDGDDIIYELALPTYSDFAGIKGGSSGKVTLAHGEKFAFALQINSVSAGGVGGLFDGQSMDPSTWPAFSTDAASTQAVGDWGYLDVDWDQDGEVGFSDVSFLINRWLSCTDPEDPTCDQPWLP